MHWISKYLGSRYVAHGRALPDLDCWGLVRAVLAERLAVTLPAFGSVHPDDKPGMTRAMGQLLPAFLPAAPADYAIACLFRGEVLLHVGVVVTVDGFRQVLHTGRRTGPRRQAVGSFVREHGAENVRFYQYVDPASSAGQGLPQQIVRTA